MSKHVKHVPKHRAAATRPAVVQAPRRALRNTLLLSSVAVAATGATIASGVYADPAVVTSAAADRPADLPRPSDVEEADPAEAPEASRDEVAERDPVVSRSDRRAPADRAKLAVLSEPAGAAITRTESLSQSAPRDIARALLGDFGFGADQFGCLDSLYTRESNWTVNADNPTSSAYGIPQALPGSKMSTAGADWATNPVTQIRWGLGYIQDRYGSPCSAWGHSQSVGWY